MISSNHCVTKLTEQYCNTHHWNLQKRIEVRGNVNKTCPLNPHYSLATLDSQNQYLCDDPNIQPALFSWLNHCLIMGILHDLFETFKIEIVVFLHIVFKTGIIVLQILTQVVDQGIMPATWIAMAV